MQAQGGTELLKKWLFENVDNDLLNQINLVSRPDDMSSSDNNILWVHDLPADMPFLASTKDRQLFKGIVFVSSWQQTVFFMNMGVQYSESAVIKNAIYPITLTSKPNDGIIRLVYHPTPHRGLELLVPSFIELCKKYNNLHLDVFSSFAIYNRPEIDEAYTEIYNICKEHPSITYHGTQSNDVVREYLGKADIFAYPCIWRETSCISAMEAMSAKCLVVAPEYAALPETLAGFNIGYSWTEQLDVHIERFTNALDSGIQKIKNNEINDLLDMQKKHIDAFYNWDVRAKEWESYLKSTLTSARIKKGGLQWN